jgi:hypothetical protein
MMGERVKGSRVGFSGSLDHMGHWTIRYSTVNPIVYKLELRDKFKAASAATIINIA